MYLAMCLQTRPHRELLPTICTLVWFVGAVSSIHMPGQVISVTERLVTRHTLVGPVSSVVPDMCCQQAFLSKHFFTDRALERFLLQMSQTMLGEVTAATERPVTADTLIRLLPGSQNVLLHCTHW